MLAGSSRDRLRPAIVPILASDEPGRGRHVEPRAPELEQASAEKGADGAASHAVRASDRAGEGAGVREVEGEPLRRREAAHFGGSHGARPG